MPTAAHGWRTHAKLAAAPAHPFMGGCVFGLYRAKTHEVLPIPECSVHHPKINQAVKAVERASVKTKTQAYVPPAAPGKKAGTGGKRNTGRSSGNLKAGEGHLRYIQLSVERSTGLVALTVVLNFKDFSSSQPVLARLTKELRKKNPDLFGTIWVNFNTSPGNTIFNTDPASWQRLHGTDHVREPIAGAAKPASLFFTPTVFRQGNMDGFETIALAVAAAVKEKKGKRVCELYAGVGMLGLTVFSKVGEDNLEWIRCSDSNPNNLNCFRKALKSLAASSPTASEKLTYTVATAASALDEGEGIGADVVIVDPPRAGLESEVVEALSSSRRRTTAAGAAGANESLLHDATTLIYVSCGFDALARDLDALFKADAGWVLEKATGYLLFPGSNHVETLCVLTRK